MDVGERIRLYRNLKGLTQTQLAELADIHPVSIRKYEAGMMKPREAQIRKLADALGINTFALQDDECPKLRFDTEENIAASMMFLFQIGVLLTEDTGDSVSVKLHPALALFLVNEYDNIRLHHK